VAGSRNVRVLWPETLEEAVALKGREGDRAEWVAGGTDRVLKHRMGKPAPAVFIQVPAHRGPPVEVEGKRAWVSARVPLAVLAESALLESALPLLAEGLRHLGSPLIRNLGTLGGNLGNASPCCDSGPPLLAYDAAVVASGPRGSREVPVAEFFVSPGKTCLARDEVIDAVVAGVPEGPEHAVFRKFGPRRANVIASANMAFRCAVRGGAISLVRVAAGSVAPRPVRLAAVERVLEGRAVSTLRDEETLGLVERSLSQDIRPISDVRGSAWYKATAVRNAVLWALEQVDA